MGANTKRDMAEKSNRSSEGYDRGGYGGGGGYDRGDRGGYGGGGGGEYGMDKDGDDKGRRSFGRKKICKFCSDLEYILDYKDVRMMQSFVSEYGKIVPRRVSGTCATHQRKLTIAVKRARNLALVGYVSMGN